MSDIFMSASPVDLQVKIEVTFPKSLLEMDKAVKKKLPSTLRKISIEAKNFWKSEAGRKLKSSRLEYQKSIDVQAVDATTFDLTLKGFLAFSIDQGGQSFDMKPGLLKNAKVSKTGGRYRVIPLNTRRYVNMPVPTKFATVTDKSTGWMHPGWQGTKISETVVEELDKNIIPKHMKELLETL